MNNPIRYNNGNPSEFSPEFFLKTTVLSGKD